MRLLSLLTAVFLLSAVPVVAQSSLPPNVPLKIRLQFQIKPQELDELRSVLTQFAKDEQFAISDMGAQMLTKGRRVPFYLELGPKDGSIEIDVNNLRAEDLIFVWFYEYRAGSNLVEVDSMLEQILREKWPTLAPYRGS